MKKYLSDIFNQQKNTIVTILENEFKIKGNKVKFDIPLRIQSNRGTDELFCDYVEVEYDAAEKHWYVHNFITNTDLSVDEYWTPLRDLSFDELYKLTEML